MNNSMINLVEARREAEVCNLIGRGNKMSFVCLDKKRPGKIKCHMTDNFTLNYNTAMLKYAAHIIDSAVNRGVGLNMLAVDNVAMTYRYYRKVAKDCQRNVDRVIAVMTGSRYFQINEDDNESMVAMKEESGKAIAEFIEAMAKADELGVYIEIQKASEFNQLILNVPEDVEIEADQILTFKNGRTEDGITVQGWSTFSRDKAKVNMKSVNGINVYFLYKKSQNGLSPLEKTQRDALAQQWAECPATEIKVDINDVEEETPMFSL